MIVSFPSKTFLIGEYAVLDRAPCVLVNTSPRFEFCIDFSDSRGSLAFRSPDPSASSVSDSSGGFSSESAPVFPSSHTDPSSLAGRSPVSADSPSSSAQSSSFGSPRSFTSDLSPASLSSFVPAYQFFHPESPAGCLIKKHQKVFSDVWIACKNPHQGQSGFGLSSAEFNCMYFIFSWKNHQALKNISLKRMWKTYRLLNFKHRPFFENSLNPSCSGFSDSLPSQSSFVFSSIYSFLLNGFLICKNLLRFWKKIPYQKAPSGADVVSQWTGDVCLFTLDPFKAESIKWPDWDLDFLILGTGKILNTWEHLRNLKNQDFSDLKKWAVQAVQAVQNADQKVFIRAIREYSFILDQKGLVDFTVKKMLSQFKKNKNILTAKGCGALGAEALVIFFRKNSKEEVIKFLQDSEMFGDRKVIADSQSLTHGVAVRD